MYIRVRSASRGLGISDLSAGTYINEYSVIVSKSFYKGLLNFIIYD